MPVTREAIMDALRNCYDPEIPVNIVDLGLIYDVTADNTGKVAVKMTLTSQGCPAAQSIPDDVKRQAAKVPGVSAVDVNVVWEPEWNPSMISAAGKQQLGLDV